MEDVFFFRFCWYLHPSQGFINIKLLKKNFCSLIRLMSYKKWAWLFSDFLVLFVGAPKSALLCKIIKSSSNLHRSSEIIKRYMHIENVVVGVIMDGFCPLTNSSHKRMCKNGLQVVKIRLINFVSQHTYFLFLFKFALKLQNC